MRHTELYRQQHATIVELLRKLEQDLDVARLQQNTMQVWHLLAELSGQIIVHLSGEDRWLYPELRSCGDPQAEVVARAFSEEMGHIANAFKAYTERWLMPSAIANEPQAFIAQTREIAQTLHHRMRREHIELYALADRLYATSTAA
ncbi:MAG: hemerythrin domain-containing protein [Gammaproteobacteria bacterium]|nr:hemerythrin domain-containing protein [Gammaproteobacteria bacterium]